MCILFLHPHKHRVYVQIVNVCNIASVSLSSSQLALSYCHSSHCTVLLLVPSYMALVSVLIAPGSGAGAGLDLHVNQQTRILKLGAFSAHKLPRPPCHSGPYSFVLTQFGKNKTSQEPKEKQSLGLRRAVVFEEALSCGSSVGRILLRDVYLPGTPTQVLIRQGAQHLGLNMLGSPQKDTSSRALESDALQSRSLWKTVCSVHATLEPQGGENSWERMFSQKN